MITLKSKILNDEYTQYVYDTFDIQNKEETVVEIPNDIDLSGDWNIGVIYGSSGSGKTSILKSIKGRGSLKEPVFFEEEALISNFGFMSPEEAAYLLSSIGLGSVPTWLRPYHLLSNGEQYRAKLAYKLGLNDDVLIDEYTSVVDRDVAKAMSFALQKYVRKTGKKVILASCHYDIMEWLQPDWIYSTITARQVEMPECRRRPKITLQVHRTTYDTWNLFKQHHYLTEDVSKACKFYLFTWNNRPVGFNAVIPQPSGWFQNGVRESRLVVLPDFQGLGLGVIISELTAELYKDSGYRYFTKTVHPALGEYRNNHPEIWKPTAKNGISDLASLGKHSMEGWKLKARKSYCHEFIGDTGIIAGDFIKKSTKQLLYERNNI